MHPDLSPHLHTEECNNLAKLLKDCHTQNSFMKFLGTCSDAHSQLYKCLMKEREINRQKNAETRWKKTNKPATTE